MFLTLFLLNAAEIGESAKPRPPIIGHLHNGRIFTVRTETVPVKGLGKKKPGKKIVRERWVLLVARKSLPLNRRSVPEQKYLLLTEFQSGNQWMGWQFAHDFVWVNPPVHGNCMGYAHRISLNDLDCFDVGFENRAKVLAQRYPKEYAKKLPPIGDESKKIAIWNWPFNRNAWSIKPAEHAHNKLLPIGGAFPSNPIPKGAINVGIAPVDSTTILCFIRTGATMTVWRGKGKRTQRQSIFTHYWQTRWICERVMHTWPSGGAFLPYIRGKSVHFVTEHGELLIARENENALECLWDSDTPIRAVITDTSSQKSFAFVHPAKECDSGRKQTSVFFELSDKLNEIEFNPKKVLQTNGEMSALVEYVRILSQFGKVKLKKRAR